MTQNSKYLLKLLMKFWETLTYVQICKIFARVSRNGAIYDNLIKVSSFIVNIQLNYML